MRFQQHFRFLFRRSLTIKFVRQTHEKLIPIIEIQRIERQLNDRDTERESITAGRTPLRTTNLKQIEEIY